MMIPLALTLLFLTWAAPALATDDLARMIQAAKAEGGVHYQDAIILPSTNAALAAAFRKKFGLPASFKVTHTLSRTGEIVAAATHEIKARRFSTDIVWVGVPPFFKAAARLNDFLPYASPEWRPYDAVMKRLGLEAAPPQWITPTGYAFVPTWNRACPGFEHVKIESWNDLLNPAFRSKTIMGDIRKSGTQTPTSVSCACSATISSSSSAS